MQTIQGGRAAARFTVRVVLLSGPAMPWSLVPTSDTSHTSGAWMPSVLMSYAAPPGSVGPVEIKASMPAFAAESRPGQATVQAQVQGGESHSDAAPLSASGWPPGVE